MKVVVLGAGVIGTLTAWYLLEHGHEVIIIDRASAAAMETSYANGAQISVCYCEPWANPAAPLKLLKWLPRDDAPLLFRLKLDPHQWSWGLRFLSQCTGSAFDRNVRQLVALGQYSHAAFHEVFAKTGIECNREEKGILHFFTSQQAMDNGSHEAAVMQRYGVKRDVISREAVLQVEPALQSFAEHIVGGTYTPEDESGDAFVFAQKLMKLCLARGATALFQTDILGFECHGAGVTGVQVKDQNTREASTIKADAYVAALGSFTAPLLRRIGIYLPIYPTKGYSATMRLKQPEKASSVSMLDDDFKIAISRLGDSIRIAGTAETAGYDTSLNSSVSKVRCKMLVERYEQLFPGVADTTEPNFWAGLRPSTPSNVPIMGRSKYGNLWINSGHGSLGWTHSAGSGRAVAELISGKKPDLAFRFCGV
ncbi:D-amino acid dehydrogenase [Saezia sanguinis]|uniref:D-amino acid dehydrogenase n=1 Tax=Saezia sanguinis TaxID=1965230 RepID=UPI00305473DC